MVRVFKYSFIIIFFGIVSCMTIFTKKNSEGMMRFKINRFSIKPSMLPLNEIDTNFIYVNYANFFLNDKNNFDNGFSYFKRSEDENFNYNGYIVFFQNGRVGLYSISKDKKISKELFNPKNANMGVYGLKKDVFSIRFLVRGDGGGTTINKKLVYSNSDTLYFLDKVGNLGSVYIKMEASDTLIPKIKPDW
jgi:hypothetical protein